MSGELIRSGVPSERGAIDHPVGSGPDIEPIENPITCIREALRTIPGNVGLVSNDVFDVLPGFIRRTDPERRASPD